LSGAFSRSFVTLLGCYRIIPMRIHLAARLRRIPLTLIAMAMSIICKYFILSINNLLSFPSQISLISVSRISLTFLLLKSNILIAQCRFWYLLALVFINSGCFSIFGICFIYGRKIEIKLIFSLKKIQNYSIFLPVFEYLFACCIRPVRPPRFCF
jgi:hypothetical protein